MPTDPPQRGTAFARSKYSPVTLYYSPAITILNENPVHVTLIIQLLVNENPSYVSKGKLY